MANSQGLFVFSVITLVTVSAAVYLLSRPPKSIKQRKSKRKQGKGGAEGSGTEPEESELAASDLSLNYDQLLSIFNEITGRMQHVVMRLAEEEQRVAQQSASSGQELQPQEIQRYLIARFEEAMREIENQVYAKYKTKEEDVRQATQFYSEDESLQRAISTLKALYNAVMGKQQDLPPVPENLTVEKVLQVLEGTMAVMRQSAENTRKELQTEGIEPNPTNPTNFNAKFQPRYSRAVEVGRAKLLKEFSIEKETVLQAAVVKYQNDPTFQQQLKQITDVHNKKMVELGFASTAQ